MAKKRQMRQKVREKQIKVRSQHPSEGAEDDSAEDAAEAGMPSSARVQRKVTRAVKFLDKLKATQDALATRSKGVLKKTKRKEKGGKALQRLQAESVGLALGSLAESLGGALPQQLETSRQPTKVLSAKSKQKLVLHETKQLSAVLSHPAFQSNPFAAVHEHLQRRVPQLHGASTAKASKAGGDVSMRPATSASNKKGKTKKGAKR